MISCYFVYSDDFGYGWSKLKGSKIYLESHNIIVKSLDKNLSPKTTTKLIKQLLGNI